jgi:hypothetical protein
MTTMTTMINMYTDQFDDLAKVVEFLDGVALPHHTPVWQYHDSLAIEHYNPGELLLHLVSLLPEDVATLFGTAQVVLDGNMITFPNITVESEQS